MLVGADGIWSAVRAEMYNEGAVKAPSKDGRKILLPVFFKPAWPQQRGSCKVGEGLTSDTPSMPQQL